MRSIPPGTEVFSHQKGRRARHDHERGAGASGTDGSTPGTGDRSGDAQAEAAAEQRIRSAIADRSFEIHFQPIVDLDTGRHLGAEALSRFSGVPQRTPDRWFAEASTVGLRAELEITAVELAFAELHRLPVDRFLSVNVSTETLLADRFRDALQSVEADQVVLELSGRPLAADDGTLARTISDLRAGGIRVAIGDSAFDDAALRRLLQAKPDIVKLDMAPDRGMSPREVLGQALLRFGYDLYTTTMVAQGIETRESIEVLRSLGCSVGQGFALARPSQLIAPPTFLLPPPPVLPGAGEGPAEAAPEAAEGPDLPVADDTTAQDDSDDTLLGNMLLDVS